jgi:hypothetical protein
MSGAKELMSGKTHPLISSVPETKSRGWTREVTLRMDSPVLHIVGVAGKLNCRAKML